MEKQESLNIFMKFLLYKIYLCKTTVADCKKYLNTFIHITWFNNYDINC